MYDLSLIHAPKVVELANVRIVKCISKNLVEYTGDCECKCHSELNYMAMRVLNPDLSEA